MSSPAVPARAPLIPTRFGYGSTRWWMLATALIAASIVVEAEADVLPQITQAAPLNGYENSLIAIQGPTSIFVIPLAIVCVYSAVRAIVGFRRIEIRAGFLVVPGLLWVHPQQIALSEIAHIGLVRRRLGRSKNGLSTVQWQGRIWSRDGRTPLVLPQFTTANASGFGRVHQGMRLHLDCFIWAVLEEQLRAGYAPTNTEQLRVIEYSYVPLLTPAGLTSRYLSGGATVQEAQSDLPIPAWATHAHWNPALASPPPDAAAPRD